MHTDVMRKQLSSRFYIGEKKIDVISHGELGSLYQLLARRSGVAKEPRDSFTLLFFGRIWAYKGLRYLLEAYSIVKREVPEARLIIAGRGGNLAANQPLIRALQGVEVLDGVIPPEQVAGLFERSSVVVLPYIEASQSGVASIGFTTGAVVVASSVGGFTELISDQQNGILVPPRDSGSLASALISILRNTDRQSQLRQCALKHGQNGLGWASIAEKTLATYKAALEKG